MGYAIASWAEGLLQGVEKRNLFNCEISGQKAGGGLIHETQSANNIEALTKGQYGQRHTKRHRKPYNQ